MTEERTRARNLEAGDIEQPTSPLVSSKSARRHYGWIVSASEPSAPSQERVYKVQENKQVSIVAPEIEVLDGDQRKVGPAETT